MSDPNDHPQSLRRRRRSRVCPVKTTELLFETCEQRLVLSAQLLLDVLGDQALEMHGSLAQGSIPLETHLQEAHAATGLDSVREQFGLTGSGQTVAVIDSGIAWDHVALGQGYGPGYRVVGGWDFTEENDNQPYDDGPTGFHGTHVSGIIGSDDPHSPGVAPDVDLVALRVFNDAGQGQLAWVEKALQWVHSNQNSFENPITTINLSIGTEWNGGLPPQWATLEDEFQQLAGDGITVVASAGNSFQQYQTPGLSYPAASPYVLPVASVDDDGSLSGFSQRHERVLAAPGSNILSTIPDHVLGRDGNINDFGTASGTSMAAPYVAGASVLVRQAMEMTGWESINATTVVEHLRSTADTVFDTATGSNYDSLNLRAAIESLIPTDTVGDNAAQASQLDLTQPSFDTWINSLQDTDVYQFVAGTNGDLTLDANSEWVDSLNWTLRTSAGHIVGQGAMDPTTVELLSGQSYELVVSAGDAIGPASVGLTFQETVAGGEPSAGNGAGQPSGSGIDLGSVRYYQNAATDGYEYQATAAQAGTFTVQWTSDLQQGNLTATTAAGEVYNASAWQNGMLRIDIPVEAGQSLDIVLPSHSSGSGELTLANVLERTGDSAFLRAGGTADSISLNLNHGIQFGIGSVAYAFDATEIRELTIDGGANNDALQVVGSSEIDKVDLRPGGSTIETRDIQIVVAGVEEIAYSGGGGADRVYLYDSDTDDTLNIRPGSAELVGVGYRFDVEDISRIFIHATGGGQDHAFLHDSVGDDRLSVRPQFTSLSGDGFFNYVRGFERVYAYANAGGHDVANLYDSSGDDRFSTGGVSASIVGPGFSSFTRSFEEVFAHASAGGNDLATLYGAGSQTQWQQGSDFISFREAGWEREARGFGQVETYLDSQPFALGQAANTGPVSLATSGSPAVTYDTPSATQDAATQNAVARDTLVTLQGHPSLVSTRWEWGNEFSDPHTAPVELAEAMQPLPETELLRDTISLRDSLASKLHLPEERLLADPDLEQTILDEAFRQFEESF